MRHFGFCKNFTGKRHKLPSKITDQLYKDGVVKKHVKPSKQDFFGKKVEKIETGDYNSDTTGIFSSFINKYMIKTGDVHVSRIELNKPKTKKNKFNEYSIHTTYTCTNCNTANVIFNVTNKKIKQVCKCTNREHFLPEKIVTKL